MNILLWIALASALIGGMFKTIQMSLRYASHRFLANLLGWDDNDDDCGAKLERLRMRLQMVAGINAMLCGLTVFSVILYEVEKQAEWSPVLRVVVAIGASIALLSVFHLGLPLAYARYAWKGVLTWSFWPMRVLAFILSPLVLLLGLADPMVRRLMGAPAADEDQDLSERVTTFIDEHHSGEAMPEEQRDMLEAVFDLPDIDAGSIMTPRTDVMALDIETSIDEAVRFVAQSGHSRLPVFRESLDHVEGVLYAMDLLRHLAYREGGDKGLHSLIREPLLVPESKAVSELLREFRAKKVHMAMVLDEYGGTAGVVTIEDALEEIVGEIRDEHDYTEVELKIETTEDGWLHIPARLPVEDFAEAIGESWEDEGEFDTVAGLVLSELQHIPAAGEAFDWRGHHVVVAEASRVCVLTVRVKPKVRDTSRDEE